MFSDGDRYTPDATLIAALNEDFGFTSNFREIKEKWFTFIPFFYKLQRHNQDRSLKNFKLIPQMSNGRKSTKIDTRALWEMLKVIRLLPADEHSSWRVFYANREAVWKRFFNIDLVTTSGRKFTFFMQCDGISATPIMERDEKEPFDPWLNILNCRAK